MEITRDIQKLMSLLTFLFMANVVSEVIIHEYSFMGTIHAINKLSTILFVVLLCFLIAIILLHTWMEVMNEKDNHGNV